MKLSEQAGPTSILQLDGKGPGGAPGGLRGEGQGVFSPGLSAGTTGKLRSRGLCDKHGVVELVAVHEPLTYPSPYFKNHSFFLLEGEIFSLGFPTDFW